MGLYACRVKRLETGKRIAAHFLGFIGSVGFIGLIASLLLLLFVVCLVVLCSCSLCWLCFLCWVGLLVVLFPFGRYDKRKGAPCWRVLSSWVVVCVIRLLIVRGLPAIPFQLLRGSVRNCSNVGGSRHNIGNQSR